MSEYSEINAGVLKAFMLDLRRSPKSPNARLDETLKDIFGLNLPSIAIYLFLLETRSRNEGVEHYLWSCPSAI